MNEGTRQSQDYVLIDAELVNQSEKNMSLTFVLLLKIPTKTGKCVVAGGEGEWRTLTGSSISVLNLPPNNGQRIPAC